MKRTSFKDYMLVACCVTVLVVLLSAGIWWESFKYHDCLNVGHSKLYCMAKIFE